MNNLKCRKQKINGTFECKKSNKIINIKDCNNCIYKEYKDKNKEIKKLSKPSKRTQALAISKKVKLIVWERDNHRCIFCDCLVPWNLANSHFIKRSHGGLGIPKNIFCACLNCHREYDDGTNRNIMMNKARNHLKSKYDGWNEKDLVYKKEQSTC